MSLGGSSETLVVWDDGDSVAVRADQSAVRFLFVSGKPLNESIALWSFRYEY
jgi:redox-sensitive bicupin YhaK (pirin superfamily)